VGVAGRCGGDHAHPEIWILNPRPRHPFLKEGGKMRRFTITDGVDKNDDLSLLDLIRLSDFSSDEVDKIMDLELGSNVVFDEVSTIPDCKAITVIRTV